MTTLLPQRIYPPWVSAQSSIQRLPHIVCDTAKIPTLDLGQGILGQGYHSGRGCKHETRCTGLIRHCVVLSIPTGLAIPPDTHPIFATNE